MTRTQAAAKNLKSAFFGIFINMLLSFSGRRVFVTVLGKEYAGLSSLFGNIINILSVLDFGFSASVLYSLYKPLLKKDYKRVSDIMSVAALMCMLSAALVFSAGLVALPYVSASSGIEGAGNTAPIFLVFLASHCLSYTFLERKLLLFADQKGYICQNFQYVFGALSTGACAAVLLCTGNYILFLLVQTAVQFVESIAISRYVKKKYKNVGFSPFRRADGGVVRAIVRDTISYQPNNIGATLMRSCDNLIVAHLFGIAQNGVYSNYNMLISTASMVSLRLVGAITASVGNLGADDDGKRGQRVFSVTMLVSFYLACICTTVLCVLSGDIIKLWLGEGMTLPFTVSCTIAASFFVSGLRQGVLIFKDAYGLYCKEKIKPFIELILSLILIVFFGKRMGIAGVYFGQLVTSCIACLWYEPYILYKYGFHDSVIHHYRRILSYSAIAFVSCLLSSGICSFNMPLPAKAAVCIFTPCLLISFFYCGTYEFKRAVSTSLQILGLTHRQKESFRLTNRYKYDNI